MSDRANMASTTSEPVVCPYCGRIRRRAKAPNGADVVLFNRVLAFWGYENCDCEGAERARQKELEDAKREAFLLERKRREKAVARTGIPKRYREAKADVAEYLDAVRQGRSLVFSGDVGTGKTHLACAIALSLMDEMKVRYTTIAGLNAALFDKNIGDAALFSSLSSCDLLILDDLGKDKVGEWISSLVYRVINDRYESGLPMIVTTNFSLNELNEKFSVANDASMGKAIVSRLYEMCGGSAIRFYGDDKRLETGFC